MATEIARMDITSGNGASFEAAAAKAVALFEGAAGCRGMRLTRSHEVPDRYWDRRLGRRRRA
jgi:heme-degrading monooxygenase HmoA